MSNDKLPIYVNFKYLNKFYQNFFDKSYQKLGEINSNLFKSEEEYNTHRLNLKEKIIMTKFNFLITSTVVMTGTHFAWNFISPYLTMRRLHFQQFRFPIVLLTGLFTYRLNNYWYVNLSKIININSKFGIYFWLEYSFRNNRLQMNLLNINEYMVYNYDQFVNSKMKNLEKLDLFLFYNDLKTHYLSMIIIKSILINLNGDNYYKHLDRFKYGKENKNLLSSFKRNIEKEYFKLILNKNEKYLDKVEIPILTKDNITNFISRDDLAYLNYELSLREKLIETLKLN